MKGSSSVMMGKFDDNGAYLATHFAPENIRDGQRLIEAARQSDTPIYMAVTGNEKLGDTS